MKKSFSFFITLLAALPLVAGNPIEFLASSKGSLKFDGGEIDVAAHTKGWNPLRPSSNWEEEGSPLYLNKGRTRVFEKKSRWQKKGRKVLQGEIVLKCLEDIELQRIALIIKIPASCIKGNEWPKKGRAADFRIPTENGRSFTLKAADAKEFEFQDSRKWSSHWSLIIGKEKGSFKKGDIIRFTAEINSDNGIKLTEDGICIISPSEEWIPIDNKKDIVPGSALDFSAMRPFNAPAGQYGWLKAIDGHFEFEGMPGREQRFCGVNLCFSANYPTHEVADRLTKRIAMLGYNSLRIHHHDSAWNTPENIDKLDYLLASAFRNGLYITTDLYISRAVSWQDIGIDRKGNLTVYQFKRMILSNDKAYGNWCDFAKKFLEHVNPYTGRALKDEPGIPLISLINEGKMGKGFNREKNDSTERKFLLKAIPFLRSIGCKALLTNDNNGVYHAAGEGCTDLYDYVDNHGYVDHPLFLVRDWHHPSTFAGKNPAVIGPHRLFKKAYAAGETKPYTITEWNYCYPGHYRGAAGLITGAMSSIQNWDGLWRFAYSHSVRNLSDGDGQKVEYFDLAADALAQASDRATICLFLRRDALEERDIVLDKEKGALKVETPRTCGLFVPDGAQKAGVLEAEVSLSPTTIWISSLDGRELKESGRILLTHLTDAQGNGTVFAEKAQLTLLKWGEGLLVKKGKARICLSLDNPDKYSVYELDTAGNRVRRIKCRASAGKLKFEIRTDNPAGAGIYYEICNSPLL